MASDQELEALRFLQPDTTAAQYLAATYAQQLKVGLPFLDRQIALRPATFLEVGGLSGSGKTELLYRVAATCVLPSSTPDASIPLYGHHSHVIFFDLDGKFDIVRFTQITGALISSAYIRNNVPLNEATITDMTLDAVSRLHVISCPSSFYFLAALKVVKPLVHRLMQTHRIGAILVDNVAAHYYVDRAAKAPSTSAGGGLDDITRNGAPLSLSRVHAAMAAGLLQLQLAAAAPVIATKHFLTQPSPGSQREDVWVARETMLKPWIDAVTHRIVLRRKPGSLEAGLGQEISRGHIARRVKPDSNVEDEFYIGELGLAQA